MGLGLYSWIHYFLRDTSELKMAAFKVTREENSICLRAKKGAQD